MKRIAGDEFKSSLWDEKYKGDPIELVKFMVNEIKSSFPEEDIEFFEWHFGDSLWAEMKKMFLDGRAVPGGRVLKFFGEKMVGNKKNLTPANCFVNPIHEDSMEEINRCDRELTEIFKWGGGVGTVISALRPRNSLVSNAAEKSSGAASFVEKFDVSTKIVGQDGRRGAHMCAMAVQHPDVEEFIDLKINGGLEQTNISVMINEGFMKALDEGGQVELWWPKEINDALGVGPVKKVKYIADCYSHPDYDYFQVESDESFRKKETHKVIPAKDIWRKISYASWSCGDPGIMFWDRMREDNSEIHGTNPCGEQPLPAYCSCALAHENFAFLNGKDEITRTTELCYIFLNGLLWYCIKHKLFPLEEQIKATEEYRPIGIGFLGLADYFIKRGVYYGEPKSIVLLENLMQWKKETEDNLNAMYGKFHGKEKFNCQTSTVAPVGSGSMLLGSSSGIEPLYEVEYYKLVRGQQVKMTHEIPKGKRQFAITAHQIPPEKRIAIQETAQRYTDGAISSTVNLPKTAKVVDIEYIYYLAFIKGLKGVTVFRDGCKQGALSTTFNREDVGRHSVLNGKTVKIPFPKGWYVTVNFFNGSPVEVFVNAGKAGSEETAWTEMAGRLISLHLRKGGNLEAVLEELDGIKGPSPTFKNGWVLQSGPDAIGKGISVIMASEGEEFGTKEVCQKCNTESYIRIGGCGQCLNCGFTQCE